MDDLRPITTGEWIGDLVMVGSLMLAVGVLIGVLLYRRV